MMMSFAREIGRHPGAGVWLIAQLLLVVIFRAAPPGGWWLMWFIPLASITTLIQFPAAPIVLVTTTRMFAAWSSGRGDGLLDILVVHWVSAAFLNYIIWVYVAPRLADWVEARLPSGLTYFRR